VVDDVRIQTTLEDRAHAARVSLAPLLRPRSIAVVGAGDGPRTIPGLLMENLVRSGFGGPLFPVNPNHRTVQGRTAYPDLTACPEVPDLVVVCIRGPAVPEVMREAGDLGVKTLCVISGGFAESGAEGALLQAKLVGLAADRGVRLVGPNCTGILGGTGDRRFNATFSRLLPQTGGVFLVSQSGAVGVGMLEAAEVRGLGIGTFVSVGNCADVTANDLLLACYGDESVAVVLLYLESLPDPPSFVRVARWVGASVPIVVMKAGRTAAGRRAATSHTAALSAGDAAVSGLLDQAGVIRAESIEEMLDLANVLSVPRRPSGRRVAVVTNGGGPGIVAADACEMHGLSVPALGADARQRLRAFLSPEASVANPVDMIADASADDYRRAVLATGATSEVDAVMVVFNTPLLTGSDEVASELVAARAELDPQVDLVAAFVNRPRPPVALADAGIACLESPERAGRALGRAVSWQERRKRPAGRLRRPPVDLEHVRRVVDRAVARTEPGGWMRTDDALALVEAYGIATPRWRIVHTPDEAARAQMRLAGTVVVKVASAVHKTELDAVRLGLGTPEEAAEAVRGVQAGLRGHGMAAAARQILVQEQVDASLEMIVGVERHPVLGPLIVVGLGGRFVELLGDVAIRLAPVTDADVEEMLHSLRSYPLLAGYRGASARDVDSLSGVVHAVSALAVEVPAVTEMDLNPVLVLEKGALCADARVRLDQT